MHAFQTFRCFVFAVALIALGRVTPASAQLVPTPPPPPGNFFFDYFVADNAGQPAENLNALFNWNVTNGSVDLVGGNVPGADDLPDGDMLTLAGRRMMRVFRDALGLPILAKCHLQLVLPISQQPMETRTRKHPGIGIDAVLLSIVPEPGSAVLMSGALLARRRPCR